jgi:hypothetical protein
MAKSQPVAQYISDSESDNDMELPMWSKSLKNRRSIAPINRAINRNFYCWLVVRSMAIFQNIND